MVCADAMAAFQAKSPLCDVNGVVETQSEASQDDRMSARSSHYEWPPKGWEIDSDGHWTQYSRPLSEPSPPSPTRSELGLSDSPDEDKPAEEDRERQQHRDRMVTLTQRVKYIEWILRNHSTAEAYVVVKQTVHGWATADETDKTKIEAIDSKLIAAAQAQQ